VTLTYLTFLTAFVVPPLAALGAWRALGRTGRHRRLGGVGVLVVVALVYTAPWDNYLVGRSVWWYGDGVVLARVWRAPLEEYLFIVGQTLLAGLWVQSLPHRPEVGVYPDRGDVVTGALLGLGIGTVGLALVTTPATFYLGAILAWAGPVLALQWAVGWRYLWSRRWLVAAAALPPTLYLATADRYAIAEGVWSLSEGRTTGLTVLGLPVEEGAFFLLTNLFIAQGLLLYGWVMHRWGRLT
jgi:lycopene cyclase domain-containing protein